MAYLNRKQILSAKLPTREVTVEEWGGEVVIRSLSIKQRVEMLDAFMAHEREVDAYNEDQALPENERKGVAKVDHLDQAIFQLIYSIVDQNNKLMFTMADYEDFKELDYPTTQRLYSAFLELNAPKSVDTLKKKLRLNHERRFAHRLALALGWSMAKLDAEMSPDELVEWAAYYDFEPWGAPVEDQRWQTLCDLTVRMNSEKPPKTMLQFFDRDPDETARLAELERAREARGSALDAKIEAFFEQKMAMSS